MGRYNYYIQDDQSSCGVYCVAMILSYHGRHENILKLKQAINPNFSGVSVGAMIGLLKNYNIEAKGYQSNLDSFLNEANLPSIVLTRNENNNHFVVVFKTAKNKVLVGDPEKGKRTISRGEFQDLFGGIVINIEHVGRFDGLQKENSLIRLVSANLALDRFVVGKLVLYSIIIASIALAVSVYYNNVFQNNMATNLVLVISFGVVIAIVLKSLLELVRSYLFVELQKHLMERIILKTMANLVYLEPFFYENLKQGKTLAKINNLFVFCATLSSWYTILSFDLVMVVVMFGTIGLLSWELLVLVIVVMVGFGWVLSGFLDRLKTVEERCLGDEEVLNETVLELIGNYGSIRQFGLNSFFKKKLEFHYHNFSQNYGMKNQLQIKIRLFGDLVVNIMAIMIVIMAMVLPFAKTNLLLVYLVFSMGARFLMNIVTLAINYPQMINIFAKYQLLLPEKPQPKRKIKHRITQIECCNLGFCYGNQVIFNQFNQSITKNTLIVGTIGSGKTTLSRLICGDLTLQAGEILINGQNLNEYDMRQLKKRIIYLDKEPVFFQESLRFNILLNSPDEEKMTTLLNLFNQGALISLLDCQLDQDFLSAGMAQIVMLTRALCNGTDVIILDEALSNIDLPTLEVIVDYLAKSDIIVLMITHNTKLMNLCSLYDRIEII